MKTNSCIFFMVYRHKIVPIYNGWKWGDAKNPLGLCGLKDRNSVKAKNRNETLMAKQRAIDWYHLQPNLNLAKYPLQLFSCFIQTIAMIVYNCNISPLCIVFIYLQFKYSTRQKNCAKQKITLIFKMIVAQPFIIIDSLFFSSLTESFVLNTVVFGYC